MLGGVVVTARGLVWVRLSVCVRQRGIERLRAEKVVPVSRVHWCADILECSRPLV